MRPTSILAVVLMAANAAVAQLEPTDLRCEYARTPSTDAAKPRLSWKLQSSERGQRQTAYQILVATTPEKLAAGQGDVWDSGKVASNATLEVACGGGPLRSGQRCWWKVRVWDAAGNVSQYSEASWWEMALLSAQDWSGKWISGPRQPELSEEQLYEDHPAPLLRKDFDVPRRITRARAYVSGLGYYELYLNGRKVGEQVLDPGWTTYSKRVLYSTFDVTSLLREGRNAVGLSLGNGWYNPLPLRFWGRINLREHLTIGQPRAILQLNIEYEDGSRESVVTDESWRAGEGPIVRNNIYLGEVYDARREQSGWDQPGFDDSKWAPAVAAPEPVGPLRAQSCPPIRVTATLKPIARTEPRPGVFIFDLGQNFAGWVTLRVRGPAGTSVKLRYGELLNKDGTLNVMTSVCGQIKLPGMGGPGAPQIAWQGDTYILRGEGDEVYTPRFTWHGFRYVEVSGYPGTPPMEAIEGHRLCSDVEPAGSFACSNEDFNRIQEMCLWTQQSNMFSVQSDCPHRERFGYGGDIVAAGEMAIFNFDMANFYRKAVHDLQDAVRDNGGFTETAPYVGIADSGLGHESGPLEWGTAHPYLQVHLYQYYGERRLMEEQYELTKNWVKLLDESTSSGILDSGLGDHETIAPKDTGVTGTAFCYYNMRLFVEIASILGHIDDAEHYAARADAVAAAFNKRFLRSESGQYGAGTQACQAVALQFGLVPPATRAAVVDHLVADIAKCENRLSTGIFGTKYVLAALSDNGRADLAYSLANYPGMPGWRYMLENGATTLWEHWARNENVFSHNHPMFGSVSEWFFKSLAGIRPAPAAVGFNRITIQPRIIDDLSWVRAEYNSVRGRIVSRWKKQDGRLVMEITIPPNTTATVYVPAGRQQQITESGLAIGTAKGVQLVQRGEKEAVCRVESGSYRFEMK